MSYYDALKTKWQTLGTSAIDQSRIDAAKAALATPAPVAPISGTAEQYAEYQVAADAWHMGFASIFHDAGVLAKIDAINALTAVSGRTPVAIPVVMEYLRVNGLWGPIKAAQAASQGAAAAVDYNEDPRAETIDLDLQIVQAMLADLVAHNLLTADQAGAITALGNVHQPWWQNAGYTSPIGTGDLEAVFVGSAGTEVLT